MVMRSVTSVTPFVYGGGYAVSHSEPSALIPLIGYIFSYMVYSHGHGIVMVIERLWFYMVI